MRVWPSAARRWNSSAVSMGSKSSRGQRPLLQVSDGGAHAADHFGVVGRVEDRRAGDEGVGACPRDGTDILRLDAAVDLQADVAPAGVDALAHAAQLLERAGDEALAAEARIHR